MGECRGKKQTNRDYSCIPGHTQIKRREWMGRLLAIRRSISSLHLGPFDNLSERSFMLGEKMEQKDGKNQGPRDQGAACLLHVRGT